MNARLLSFLFFLIALTSVRGGEHVILCGGPALRQWEDLRVKRDQHDRWWGNFVRASTLRMTEINKAYGDSAKIIWIVYKPGYTTRGREDGKPYTSWINDLAVKYGAQLVWVSGGGEAISAINRRPSKSVVSFDFFGHSNKYCWVLDYSNQIMGASKAWIHQNDLKKISRRVFAKNAHCQSWGCHTAESMSAYWKRALGMPLIGAEGKTDYTVVGQGRLPTVSGRWSD
ncbi:hypothetical protein [Persicirhabdus sediminis]|uniref:Uncharacterized protein n=1 Tax=Persicirhabdus sediminis TaxID=454144 RepID=A0A8J7MFU5_9BACT|nr:hypothetical protein [Persicirhabdus sediminis]MBK1791029.1 hypothetical protein [Persicirhabdus sediminis]